MEIATGSTGSTGSLERGSKKRILAGREEENATFEKDFEKLKELLKAWALLESEARLGDTNVVGPKNLRDFVDEAKSMYLKKLLTMTTFYSDQIENIRSEIITLCQDPIFTRIDNPNGLNSFASDVIKLFPIQTIQSRFSSKIS